MSENESMNSPRRWSIGKFKSERRGEFDVPLRMRVTGENDGEDLVDHSRAHCSFHEERSGVEICGTGATRLLPNALRTILGYLVNAVTNLLRGG